MTKHSTIDHPSQIALREKHRELLADIESVAERANAVRARMAEHGSGAVRKDGPGIVAAAEAAGVRVHHAWKESRGGTQNNYFFGEQSKRLRRILTWFKKYGAEPKAEPKGGDFVYKILDYEQLNFHRLKPWFRASAVDDAIKTGIHLGLRELPGLRIWREETVDDAE